MAGSSHGQLAGTGWMGWLYELYSTQAGIGSFVFLNLYHVLMEETRMDRIRYLFCLFYAFGKRRLLAFTIE